MRVVLLVIAAVLLALTVFTAANWSVLTTPTPLSFLVFELEGRLGMILLGIMLAVVVLVVGYALLLRTSWLVESRRLNRQLEEQRELAQQAESSRFSELQKMIENGFKEVHTSLEASGASEIASIKASEQFLTKSIEDAANSITAHLGYLDDKLKGGS